MSSLREALAITDPGDRARALTGVVRTLPQMASEVRAARQAAVLELREAGWSHAQVAELLGVTRGTAQAIAEGRSRGGRRRDDTPDTAEEL